jgi:imidazolonepropionase-like amidohydrolase
MPCYLFKTLYVHLQLMTIKRIFLPMAVMSAIAVTAQPTFPLSNVNDPRENCYVFTNATIIKSPTETLKNASLVIRKGFIEAVGNNISIPKDAVEVNCHKKYIYPSFIDAYSDYGIQKISDKVKNDNIKNNASWNPAMHSEAEAFNSFAVNADKAKALRAIGIGLVNSHQMDGISRGAGLVSTLAEEKENLVVIKNNATTHYSLNKGSSTYDYPNSLMGAIALLRQNILDAKWYASNPKAEGYNAGLQAFNNHKSLPQIFEANDKWQDLRACQIGKEFDINFIIKGGTNEYQRIAEIKEANASFILPVNWPLTMDVEDPLDANYVNLSDMKHWELAPTNLLAFYQNKINFAITSADCKDKAQFLPNIRKSIASGLPDSIALAALTTVPSQMLKIENLAGTIDQGKLANFIICSAPMFDEQNTLYQNWIQGIPYEINKEGWNDYRANYQLVVDNVKYPMILSGNSSKPNAIVIGKDTAKVNLSINGDLVKLNFGFKADSGKLTRLSGVMLSSSDWRGKGSAINGNEVVWYAQKLNNNIKEDTTVLNKKASPIANKIIYPFTAYGATALPIATDILIKNATVWSNEKDGILTNTDVLISNGKIKAIGKGLKSIAKIIDGTNMHVTAGIIDEHSHIAITGGVNECSQSVTAEVRVSDVLNPDDVNIYRQLSGGVTSSHLLHGSCNTIGGQTQLIKLRWGQNAAGLKFQNWDPQIKFALGENVKRSSSANNNRFPDSRMGVYQVLHDAFTRARDYQALGKNKRTDLELEALSNILNHKLFITCHSYVQSEINGLLKVADSFGFTVNTFTHILEGYKVADKMKAHGANASTFSDWWAYKMEVQDAIPQNPYIMQQVGLNVAINSDDAEMARRLNQEAAKSVKYANMEEQEAIKMVTLNPAKMLHVADRVGSIAVGKDADIAIWNDHPLSIYAKCMITMVDGIVYFDRVKDIELRKEIEAERNLLISKMINGKKAGQATTGPKILMQQEDFCEDDHHPRMYNNN